MPKILSVGTSIPKFSIEQTTVEQFVKELYTGTFKDINRLLKVFSNGQIKKRHFVKDMEWFKHDHTFEEKNEAYINESIRYGMDAINNCLNNSTMLEEAINMEEIEAIFYISTTGLATPSIEARIMNQLPFNEHTKRIPIWGLGCAGGATGLARASEYCRAFPESKVLVLAIELCSLTFQKGDTSKSNLVGTSLFADGIACVCIAGDNVVSNGKRIFPSIIDSQSTLKKNSEDVMGWDVKNGGLFVIFSRDIPTLIESWLQPNVLKFLNKHSISMNDINQCIFHPGGRKVLDAYVKSLAIEPVKLRKSENILQEYGNMSSATVLYVLKDIMENEAKRNDIGLAMALGPGFSSELVLLNWE